MLVVILGLIVGPTVAGSKITTNLSMLKDLRLVQPVNQNNNNTSAEPTGGSTDAEQADVTQDDEEDNLTKLKFLLI